jgi:uncharacterized repeat protein (TIGR01451 family)
VGSYRTPRAAGRMRHVLAALSLGALLTIIAAPATLAAPELGLTTPYPAVAVGPGSKLSFDLTVTSSVQRRVSLSVSGAPDGWTAVIRGGGFVVDGVMAGGSIRPEVRLDVSVPSEVEARTYNLLVTATAGREAARLPLSLRVAQSAVGDVTLTTEFPTLRAAADATFTFNLTLANDTAEDLTFNVTATGPEGWSVEAKLTGQSQAASAVVKAGSTTGVSIEADPPDTAEAGTYPINVVGVAGSRRVTGDLMAEVTGTNKLTLTTPDQRLSNRGSVGSNITQQLVVQNDGTAPLQNVKLSAVAPSEWRVTFNPETVAQVAPRQPQTVTATVVPSNDAIAGDYVITFNANAGETSAKQDIRYTIETSPLWGLLGIVLILAVLGGLFWVFRTYGRR